MSATSLQHKQKEIWTLSSYSEYFSLCVSLPQPCCPLGAHALKGFHTQFYWWNLCWKQSSAKQNILSCDFLTQLFKCISHIVRMTPVPTSVPLLLLNAFADQDFVFLTVPNSTTLCRHCYCENVIKICGSSTKQLLYFGAGLHKLLLGEGADVEMAALRAECGVCWGSVWRSLLTLCLPGCGCAQLTLTQLQAVRSSSAGLELIQFLWSLLFPQCLKQLWAKTTDGGLFFFLMEVNQPNIAFFITLHICIIYVPDRSLHRESRTLNVRRS